jgi:uncharacterized membrane protein
MEPVTISLSSIITVISIIALITTYLLGELSEEDRMSRDRFKPIYKRYLYFMLGGLLFSVVSLILTLLSLFNVGPNCIENWGIASFTLAIILVSTSTFLLSYELISRY